VECLTVALAPVILSFADATGAEAAAVRVRVDDSPAVTDGAVHEAVMPAGKCVADNMMFRADPAVGAVETVIDVEAPWTTVTAARSDDSEKSGGTMVTSSTSAKARVPTRPLP